MHAMTKNISQGVAGGGALHNAAQGGPGEGHHHCRARTASGRAHEPVRVAREVWQPSSVSSP